MDDFVSVTYIKLTSFGRQFALLATIFTQRKKSLTRNVLYGSHKFKELQFRFEYGKA